jgi:hypothetical protein
MASGIVLERTAFHAKQILALGWHVPHRWRSNPAAVKTSITCIVEMVPLRANGPLSFQPGATPQG